VYISESEIWEFSFTESETNQTSANFSSNTRAQKHLVQDDKATVNNQPIQLASLKIVPGLWLNQDTTPNTTSIEKTAVQFSGNARLSAGMANRVASFSELPKNQGMAELNPVLTCYGLPFATNFLLSSFQDPNRQRINNFGFNFDFNRLHEGLTTRLNRKIEELIRSEAAVVSGADTPEMNRLRDPENLKNNLKQFGMISGAEKFFMGIRSLGIGTNYPMYSEYTLSGVPVTGVNIEINPGVLYAAFAGIGNQRGIDNLAYKRSLYAGRGGFGKKEGPHVYLTGLYVKDHEGSIRLDSASHPLAPRANYVFGTEVKLNFFEDKLSLQGEGAVAVLTRDTREPEFEHENIPGFLKNIIDPRISTSVDYSYSGKLAYNYNASATMVSLGIKMVGPGYTSLGVPNLRTDQFGYEAKIDQRLFKRRTSVGTFFKQYNDNLIKWKRSTTTTTAYGVNLRLNFRRLPFLRLSYSPYSQENDDINPLRKVNNTTTVYTAMTGYSYKLGDLISSTSFTFSGQQGKTHGIGDYRTHSFMITEAVSLAIPLSFIASWGLINSKYGLENSRFNNIDLGASAQITDRWSCMAGVNLAAEKGRNNRKGFYINLSISPLKGIGIDLRAEQNIYTEKQETLGGYHEFIFSVTLISVW
ncbi:MAG: hypothetical protein Q8M23_08530, partial [Bacteroidales bacterium]|nr:hypothetical protein [Bacteroidales bacterium]